MRLLDKSSDMELNDRSYLRNLFSPLSLECGQSVNVGGDSSRLECRSIYGMERLFILEVN